uniref:Uncharacterized protein n=1 Tax=Timema douglasi TaxID=61478 RepID=A0A7R8VYR9_TIMDO|nr:unnamed protein product [Timema douglasi]
MLLDTAHKSRVKLNYLIQSDSESKSIRSSSNSHAISRLVPLGESSLTRFKSAGTCKNLFLCYACPPPCVQCVTGLRVGNGQRGGHIILIPQWVTENAVRDC